MSHFYRGISKIGAVVFLCLFLIPLSTNAAAPKVIDCKKDFNCFLQAAKKCKPAKAVLNFGAVADPFGMSIQNNDNLFEIKGASKGNCQYKMSIKKALFHYTQTAVSDFKTQGKSSAEIAQLEKDQQTQIAKAYQECKATSANLYKALLKWKKGVLDNSGLNCISKTK